MARRLVPGALAMGAAPDPPFSNYANA